MMGALQDVAVQLRQHQDVPGEEPEQRQRLALIAQSTQTSASALAAQMASTAASRSCGEERIALAQKMNPQQTNYNPPAGLDPRHLFRGRHHRSTPPATS